MANQIAGVYEKIIECAKKEFLEKGFLNASLRTIAAAADTSTGSIYTRFGDKEGLFDAIVSPAIDGLKSMFLSIQDDFHSFPADVQKESMGKYTKSRIQDMIDFIYDNYDEFRLLLDASYGTEYQSFLDELVDIEVDYTYRYMKVTGCRSTESGKVSETFIHIIVTAYFNGFFEIIRHQMPKKEAERYVAMLSDYHMAGFSTVLY